MELQIQRLVISMCLVSDNINPTISCPEDQEESVDASCNFTLPDYTSLATAADNCTDVTVTQVPAPGTVVDLEHYHCINSNRWVLKYSDL